MSLLHKKTKNKALPTAEVERGLKWGEEYLRTLLETLPKECLAVLKALR